MIEVTSAQLQEWGGALMFPFIRVLATVLSAPILSHSSIPMRARVGLALLLAIAAAGVAPAAVPLDSPHALAYAMRETLIGASLGLLLRLVFAAAELAGDAIGLQMGLGFAFFVDPQNSAQSPLLGSLLSTLAALLFLALDIHLLVIGGLMESFRVIPVDAPLDTGLGLGAVPAAGAEMFRLALSIALPALAALLLANLALGVLSRAAPQLNLFAVGFPATLVIGILAIGPALPGAVEALARAFTSWPSPR
ncbi:MAG: flagellar biosynthetic protein FliR [Betaproteobacteria bacterium]